MSVEKRVLAGLLAVAFAAFGASPSASAQERQVAQEGPVPERQASAPPDPSRLSPATRAQIEYGREIAASQCSSCHALDNEVESPNPGAPPLRNALWRFEAEPLAIYFIEALRVGHGDMPVFDFTPVGADALIAYLKSIKAPHDADER
jgi:mono/diheme cytochrome c family protein